jgi:hypothetical protein
MSGMNMLGLFRRAAHPSVDTSGLGVRIVALRLPGGCAVPAGCGGVVVSEGGRTRRVGEGKPVLAPGEQAWCFHPGPYAADIVPFAAAPEIGLRVAFAIDCPDPRQAQQRFDLYLASEGGQEVGLAPLSSEIELAVQREFAQGNLELPPCTTLDEWNAFRAGFNRLLYTRFGLTVDDCVPVDLGESRDYAAMLQARAAGATPTPTAPAPLPITRDEAPFDAPEADARALRRLFLELPSLMCRLRLAVLPPGQELFRQQQALLQRLDLASLSAGTMPALELAAPGEPLPAVEQLRRARHSSRAALGLDEAWALLARLEHADGEALPVLFDEADRIVANLERDIAARRVLTAAMEDA